MSDSIRSSKEKAAFEAWLDTPAPVADTGNPYTDRSLRNMYAAWCARAALEPETALHAFKNFHRLLCERFDYCHDEKDWQRDQLSLIEWIAKRSAWQPIETAPRDGTRMLLAANVHAFNGKPRISSGHYSTDPYIGGDNDEVIGADEGFKGDEDACIPSNQECFTHWAPIPAFTSTKCAESP